MAGDRTDATTQDIRFVMAGDVVRVADVEPTTTVLNYLRQTLRRTGTKEGCAEGDCGACTVVVGELAGDDVVLKAVNACIQFVPALDGKALFTVEDLRLATGALHPVQQAMVDCHGSQCGFCTPGFVMSLFALYAEHTAQGSRATDGQARTALTGNLCRCTGYRPILDAAQRMFELPSAPLDRARVVQQLQSIRRAEAFTYEHAGRRFFAPRTLSELTSLRAAHPEATLLAGNTDVGLWVNKQLRDLRQIIFIGEVGELREIREANGATSIGAGVNLNDAYQAIAVDYPEVDEIWERFASIPIRNAGTLGGNVANGSPIGDSMPALIALGARVVLANRAGSRSLPMEDLYLGYQEKAMAADEVITAIEVPHRSPALGFRTYKLSKRFDSDISAVCGAFAVEREGETIVACRIAFGGMAATPKRASATEAALAGKPWIEATVRAGMAALAEDYQPLTDMRASAAYRMKAAQNLLYRFFLETRARDPMPASQVRVFAAAPASG
ncbi:MAG: xanthine dehydrogenase small subunit [Casimicrobiaceae bacterium]